MQGSYRGEERAQVRAQWKDFMIPGFIKDEINPWLPLLKSRHNVTAVDIGANKGWWTKALIETVDVRHSYMIDASPENYRELAERADPLVFDQADFSKISAYHHAMGDKRGTVKLFTNDDGSPLASLYDHKLSGGIEVFGGLDKAIAVPMTTLDNFLADHQEIHRINALKIDAEGAEYRILQGAHGALAHRKIDLVFFEFGMHHVEARVYFRDFWELLTDAGFDVFQVNNHTKEISHVNSYGYQYEDFTTCHNYIAALRG